jgi:hypothetical protein
MGLRTRISLELPLMERRIKIVAGASFLACTASVLSMAWRLL